MIKILHGPFNIGNQPWSLSRAERRRGNKSDLVVRSGTWFQYPADRILYDDKATSLQKAFLSARFGMSALLRYDVLHYYFGVTFLYPGLSPPDTTSRTGRILNRLSTVDLELAKYLGKKKFMTLQGCDARLAGEGNRRNAWTMCGSGRCSAYENCVGALDARRQYLIDRVLPLFDRVFYLNPELGHVVPGGQFLPYANVEIEKFTPEYPSSQGKPRIVHAPSDASIKGTKLILEALELLKSRFDFELILVEKKTHEEALAIYQSADLAIDQVLAGWYGGFAVEMMAMGKPVACYIREGDLKFVPEAMRNDLAVLNVNPGRLAHDLSAILERRAEWKELGRQSRRYVERWHNPDVIAEAMIAAYRSPDSTFVLSPAGN
ncbi:glycosyltransferase family 4 protein [Bradyrhizobium jicamae]|uniref:glycosyltransferase family 4 protein n=1 Tax=Bradyrhizobium jicamae TaxID=280332 RepID=UPI001BA4D2BF|nr:glycosyltransferase family 4 protein [Bradyrhizobium jicamae]MBR0938039.1 glycosyltransferase family 4 protein [Bradyrhizobium jicamae]